MFFFYLIINSFLMPYVNLHCLDYKIIYTYLYLFYKYHCSIKCLPILYLEQMSLALRQIFGYKKKKIFFCFQKIFYYFYLESFRKKDIPQETGKSVSSRLIHRVVG